MADDAGADFGVQSHGRLAEDCGGNALDFRDRMILRILQGDAETPSPDIARRLQIGKQDCLRRIRQLERRQIIRGRVALLDENALDCGVTVLVGIKLRGHAPDAWRKIEAALLEDRAVLEVYCLFAEDDYAVKIKTRTLLDYERFVARSIHPFCPSATVKAIVVLRTIKSVTALPV
jgi:DNA-binding Lrp family transcriptional regulator